MKAFNFKEHTVVDMPQNYEVMTTILDYENEYINQDLTTGSNFIIDFFKDCNDLIKPNKNYVIILNIDYDAHTSDIFLLFSAFMNSFKGKKNDRGYLKAPDRVKNYVGGAEYSANLLMNQDFDYGSIQLQIVTRKETFEWVRE